MMTRLSPPSFMKCLMASVAVLLWASAHAGADLAAIQARDNLRCGVSDDIPGFAMRDASGRWQGMNVDFCRAVAAAALGSPDKVQFVPLTASKRFPALQSKSIDLLLRNTSWTLAREALLKVQFPAVLFYDGQGFLVPKSARIESLENLKGATICVEKGTTHEVRLAEYFSLRGMTVTPLVIDSARGVTEAFFAGRCSAYTSDASQLAITQARAPGGGQDYRLLPERISREPMGPVVRNGDAEWASLVRWVTHVLVSAEEFSITQANVEARARQSQGGVWRLISGKDQRVARALGVPNNWIVLAIRAGGNYGEIYERNLGAASPLAIERGANRLWTQGGLLYAPPID
jgi:general L-amino acid transport system substrate-binding protein